MMATRKEVTYHTLQKMKDFIFQLPAQWVTTPPDSFIEL